MEVILTLIIINIHYLCQDLGSAEYRTETLPNNPSPIVRLYFDYFVDVFRKIAVPVSHRLILHVIYYLAEACLCPLSFEKPLHHVLYVHYHRASFELSAESPLYLGRRLIQLLIDFLLPATLHLLPHSGDSLPFLPDDLLKEQVPMKTLEPAFVVQEGGESLSF